MLCKSLVGRLDYRLLHSCLNDLEIYEALIGELIEPNRVTFSPLRGDDREAPSFGVFAPTRSSIGIREGMLMFKDLATGISGDVIKFIKLYAAYHDNVYISDSCSLYWYLEEKINANFYDVGYDLDITQRVLSFHQKKVEIQYKTRKHTSKLFGKYWEQFGVSSYLLDKYKVRQVQNFITNGKISKVFSDEDLCMVYIIIDKEKIYQPFADRIDKFRNTCPSDDYRYYQGFTQLEFLDELIITKSYKDVLCCKANCPQFDVLAPHAESITLDPQFMEWAIGFYKRIIVVSDYDPAGIKFADSVSTEYENVIIKYISKDVRNVNGKRKVIGKDFADFINIYGRVKFKRLVESW